MKRSRNILLVGLLCLFVMLFSASYIRAECEQCAAWTDGCGFGCTQTGSGSKDAEDIPYYTCTSEPGSSKECSAIGGLQECATVTRYDDSGCDDWAGESTAYTGAVEGDVCD
jgi:hypothetical protein